MAKEKTKASPQKVMRMRFWGISGLAIVACYIGATSTTVKPLLASLLLVLFSHLFFTYPGRVIVGTWFKKEKWRNTNVSSKTKFFSYFIGLPAALVMFLIYLQGYSSAVGEAMVSIIFPPGQPVEDKMRVVQAFMLRKAPPVCAALLIFSGISLFIATIVKNIQLSLSSRMLKKVINAANAKKIIELMEWDQFEKLVCRFFQTRGYKAEVTNAGADGGVDIVLNISGKKEMVQCKHWRTNRVGVSVVREIFGVVQADGYHRGIIITSGFFTDDAWEFVKRDSVRGRVILIDGNQLISIIKNDADLPSEPEGKIMSTTFSTIESAIPVCPVCGRKMVLRKSQKNTFYGCESFPDCRGTREL